MSSKEQKPYIPKFPERKVPINRMNTEQTSKRSIVFDSASSIVS